MAWEHSAKSERSLGRILIVVAVVLLVLIAAAGRSETVSNLVLGPQVRGGSGGEAVTVLAPGQLTEPQTTEVTVTTVGDLLMHAPLNEAARTPGGGYDYAPMFAPVKEQLSFADLTIANLETTLGGPERGFTGWPLFSTPDEILDGIIANGVDAITTSNNHSLDRGGSGLLRTIAVARERGIPPIGTRAGPDEPAHVLFVRNGIRIAVLSYTYSTNGIPIPEPWMVTMKQDEDRMVKQIEAAKEDDPDLILVAMHWGIEYQRTESAVQRRLARILHQQGVHAILGTHAHVVQPFDIIEGELPDGSYHEMPVIYSTGNFISNQRQRYRDGGVMVHFTFSKTTDVDGESTVRLERVEHTPVWVHKYNDPDSLSGENFRVLPSEPGLAEDSPHMTQEHRRLKNQSFDDTLEILGPSPLYDRDSDS